MRLSFIAATLAVLGACASSPDRFYTLRPLPSASEAAQPTTHVRLDVTIPSLIDRPEMVLETPEGGILILEHERWAAPLSDQVTEILARDIERRRGDLIVADRRFDRAGSQPILLKVDIVRMAAQRAGQATLEAHWRIVDAGAHVDQMGNSVLDTPVEGEGYAAIARSYSRLLGDLADKMVAGIRRP